MLLMMSMMMMITLTMLCEQYPSLHLENKGASKGGRGDFKLQLCLFVIRTVADCGSDADNDNGDIYKDYDTGNSDDVKILMRTRCEQ